MRMKRLGIQLLICDHIFGDAHTFWKHGDMIHAYRRPLPKIDVLPVKEVNRARDLSVRIVENVLIDGER